MICRHQKAPLKKRSARLSNGNGWKENVPAELEKTSIGEDTATNPSGTKSKSLWLVR